MGDVKGFEISLDRKKMLVHKGDDFYIFDSDVKSSGLTDAKALGKAKLDLSALDPLHQSARGVSRHLPRCLAAGA